MSGLAAVGAGLGIAGTLLGAQSQRSAGRAQARAIKAEAEAKRRAAEFEAAQHEEVAGELIAASHRAAYEERKNAALLASRAQAVAGGSGAGVSDPTVVDIINQISGEGAYRAALALQEGEQAAKKHRMSAKSLRETGYSAMVSSAAEASAITRASNLSATSTILRGAQSFVDIFGNL